MRTSKWIILAALVIGTGAGLQAQAVRSAETDDLRTGITLFGDGKYEEALRRFEVILLDERQRTRHGDAFFWAAKSHLALGNMEFAERNLEHFLSFYPGDPRFPEAVYQKGRLLYLQQEYEKALSVFQSFVREYPDSEFVPNAYSWAGECLYSLGHLDEAQKIFSWVVERYPSSFRVEAARYRLSLIELRYREQEILKLLKWSHQETIRLLQEMDQRDRTYQEAIAAFRERLTSLERGDRAGEIARLTDEVASLKEKLRQREEDVRQLQENRSAAQAGPAASPGPTASATSGSDIRKRLESMRNEAEDLRDTFLVQDDPTGGE